MSDRLAAMRAQGQGSYQNNYNDGGYAGGGGGGGGGGGYQSRRPNPYAQNDDQNSYQMSAVNSGSNYGNNNYGGGGYSAPAAAPSGGVDMSSFYAEISDVQNALRSYNDNVARISDLHARSLNNMGDTSVQDQLERAIEQTRSMSNDLKKRIKALQTQGGDSREGQQRRQQAALLKTKFQEAIQNYQQVEQRHRGAQKQRMERQYRIVNPHASPEEVRAVVEDDNPGQIFQKALLDSRQGESRAAYREVQERHQDIQKIEQTIAELAQLFSDMAIMVEEQGEMVTHIEKTTETVQQDTEAAYVHTEKAKESAMSARKKRWICFIIVVIILIIVAVVIGVQVAQGNIGGGGSNNNNNSPPVTVTAPAPTATGLTPVPPPVSAKFRL